MPEQRKDDSPRRDVGIEILNLAWQRNLVRTDLFEFRRQEKMIYQVQELSNA